MSSSAAALHDPILSGRVFIEKFGQWEIWATDRKRSDYSARFLNSETPIQLLYAGNTSSKISIISPCRATRGRFEFQTPHSTVRKCCYTCVAHLLNINYGIHSPDSADWIVYMLLESDSYINGPAPQERVSA
jgi:hypothetical protein